MSHIVAIAGATGGVGRTSVTINLAAALASFGRQTIIVDCHLKKPNVGLYLGFTDPKRTIQTVLAKQHSLGDVIHVHSSGLRMILGSHAHEDFHDQQLLDAFNDFLSSAEIVLVDTPPATDSEFPRVLRVCNEVIIVVHPNQVSTTDMKRQLHVIKDSGKRILGAVVTHTKHHEHEMTLHEVQNALGIPVIGEIPYDKSIHVANAQQQPLVYLFTDAKATIGYKKLAANLIGSPYRSSNPDSILEYLLRRVGFGNKSHEHHNDGHARQHGHH